MGEAWLQSALREATARLRAQLPAEELRRLEQRDAEEQQLLLSGDAQLSPAELATLPGRTTGDAAWLAARGEDGRDGAAAQAVASGTVPAAAPTAGSGGTRYRLAKDQGLAEVQPLRLCGGAVRASGENAPGETARHAYDGSPHTKWLDFGGRAPNAAWLEYRLPAEAPPAVLGSWALTSANDEPARDPRHVVLEAWSEGGGGPQMGWVSACVPSLTGSATACRRSVLCRARGAACVGVQAGTDGLQQLHNQQAAYPAAVLVASALRPAAGSGSWTRLDERAALHFPARHHRLEFALPAADDAPPSRRFRLRVVGVADPAAANSVQLACLDLYRRTGQGQAGQQGGQQRGQQDEQQRASLQDRQRGKQVDDAGLAAEQQPADSAGDAAEQQRERLAQQAGSPLGSTAGQVQQEQPTQQPEVPAPGNAEQGSRTDNPWADLFSAG